MPILSTNIATFWASTTVEDDTKDTCSQSASSCIFAQRGQRLYSHETGHGSDLDKGKYKFRFSIASHAKHIDQNDHRPEYGHPRSI